MPGDDVLKPEDLAKTNLQRGLMQRELAAKTRIRRELIEENPNNQQPLNTDSAYFQSNIHFQAIMGDQFKEYQTAKEKIDAFNLIYQQLSVLMKDAQLQQFSKMYTEESHHPNQFVFYHATIAAIGFINDVITEFRKQLELQYADDFQILRAFDDQFKHYKDVTELMAIAEAGSDKTGGYQEIGLSVNPFLFGSDGQTGEATFYYFLNNSSQEPPDIKEIFKYFVERLQIEVDFTIFQTIFDRFLTQTGGICYQIFIDASCIDQVAMPSILNGKPNPLRTDKGELNQFSAVMAELRANPSKYAEYIKTLQARLFLNPEIFQDPNKVQIKTYHANPLSSEQEKEYRDAIRKAVSESILQLLTEHKKLSPTAFARTKIPNLHRQMDMIYQDNELPHNKNSNLNILLPELLEKEDVRGLVEVILNTEKLNLLDTILPANSTKLKNPILIELFLEKAEITVALYQKLQPYQDKEHIAKLLQQLRDTVFHYYVSIGDLIKAKELCETVLHRNTKYLTQNEIFMEENAGLCKIRQSYILNKALQHAAEQNQVEVFSWLLERSREFNIKADEFSRIKPENCLRIAVEKGYPQIVSLIFPDIKKTELTEAFFAELLALASQHDYFEVIAVILEKLKEMPKDVFDMVLLQQSSILEYLDKNRHEEILKKADIPSEKLTTDARFIIPELLIKGDIAGLIEFIVKTENIDLSDKVLVRDQGSGKYSKYTLLQIFRNHELVAAQIFHGLQQYKDAKNHIATASDQLKEIAWYHAVSIGDLDQVTKLFDANHPQRNNQLDQAISIAAKHNQIEIFTWLLKQCQKLKYESKNIGYSYSLSIAVMHGHQQILELNLNAIEATRLTDQDFRFLLWKAAQREDYVMVEKILEKLKMATEETQIATLILPKSDSLLCYLTAKGHDNLIKKILTEHSCIAEHLDKVIWENLSIGHRKSLLAIAIENHHPNIVDMLLNCPTAKPVELINARFPHPLLLAAKHNDITSVKLILQHISFLNEKDQYGKTALMVAAELGYAEIVAELINNSKVYSDTYYLSKKTNENLDILSLAARRGHLNVVGILLNSQPSIIKNLDFRNALQQAAKYGHTKLFKFITSCEACPLKTVLEIAMELDVVINQPNKTINNFNTKLSDKMSFFALKETSTHQILEKYQIPLQQLNEIAVTDSYETDLSKSILFSFEQLAKTLDRQTFFMDLIKIASKLTSHETLKLTKIVKEIMAETIEEIIKDAERNSNNIEFVEQLPPVFLNLSNGM